MDCKMNQEISSASAKKMPVTTETSIRVGVEKVDQMINLVGELVITQAMLKQAAGNMDPALYERLLNGLTQLERNTRDIQESVMSVRMMPMSMVFSRFPRVVRDISAKLGKQVELKLIGEQTELDMHTTGQREAGSQQGGQFHIEAVFADVVLGHPQREAH